MNEPVHTAHIWAEGDNFHISFPPLPGFSKSHSIVLPLTVNGFTVAAQILRERERLATKATIATSGSPIQYDIESMLKSIRKIPPKSKQLATSDLSLDDLGDLDLSEFVP